MGKSFIREQFYALLTALGALLVIYFVLKKNWFLVSIAVIFSFVAGYNTTCRKKKE